MRVVSLLPSATEIVCYLGAERDLVGRSAECDYPASIRDRPIVMHARTQDADAPSREIDARVRQARASGASLYELDVGALALLRPDLILTQDLCGVCSVTGDEVRSACRAAAIRPEILSLSPTGLAGVRESIRSIGSAIGVPESADRRLDELDHRQRSLPGSGSPARRTVAVVEWLDPPILAGLWVPEMIEAVGGTPFGGVRATEPGLRTTWERILEHPPEALVLSPCSFPVERTLQEASEPAVRRSLHSLVGVPTWIADEAYFSRPGPRLWDGLDLLAAIVRQQQVPTPMPVLRWTERATEVAA